MLLAKKLLAVVAKSPGSSDYASWTRASAVDVGDILTEARHRVRSPRGLKRADHATDAATMLLREGNETFSYNVLVEQQGGSISIGVEDFGEAEAEVGYGRPILIERHEGEERVIIWPDINDPDNVVIVPLTNAHESKRYYAEGIDGVS